jgi:hypothetical protein
MRFLLMVKATNESEAGAPPRRETVAKMGALMQEMAEAGVLLAADGLTPSSQGKRITFSHGKITKVTDGPFAETKELVAGFCMVEVGSWDDIMKWNDRFADAAEDGVTEIRPLFEVGDFPADVLPPEEAAREQALRDQLKKKNASR